MNIKILLWILIMKRVIFSCLLFSSFFVGFVKADFSNEQKLSYTWAYNNWITTMPTIDKANMNWDITRIALAKMISNYAISAFDKKLDTTKKCIFSDVTSDLDKQYDNWVTNACRLWLMGQWITKFRPYDKVTRAEVWTIISRLLYWNKYDWWNPYYQKHLNQLKYLKILNKISDADKINERRGNVMIMLKRSYDSTVKSVIEWWDWRYEIWSDETTYIADWYWFSIKLWKEFKWWLIIQETPSVNEHEIRFYVRDDGKIDPYRWVNWYDQKFIVCITQTHNYFTYPKEFYLWENSYYWFVSSNSNPWDKNKYYSDVKITEVDFKKLWNRACTENLKWRIKDNEPNWVFSEIVWNDKDWFDAWKIEASDLWGVHIDWYERVARRWILYYTNNDTKRKLDFECDARKDVDYQVSAAFWNVKFVE